MNTGLSGMNSNHFELRPVSRCSDSPYLRGSKLLQLVVTRDRVLKARKQRFLTTVDKCIALKLSPAIQSEMRWLRSSTTRKTLVGLSKLDAELRKAMRKQNIKQLNEERIDHRIEVVRAWKLAGGGNNWRGTVDTLKAMTGRVITRQAARDMILRLHQKKLVRLRRGRKKTHDPLIAAV